MLYIKRDIALLLCKKDHRLTYRVRDSHLVKDVCVPACAIGDDELGIPNCTPNIGKHSRSSEEIVGSRYRPANTRRDDTNV